MRRRLALLVNIHFDGHRNAEQRSWLGDLFERAVGRCRLSERLIGEIHHDRVQLVVQGTDAFDDRQHHVGTGKSLLSDTSGNLDRAFLPQRLTHDDLSSAGVKNLAHRLMGEGRFSFLVSRWRLRALLP